MDAVAPPGFKQAEGFGDDKGLVLLRVHGQHRLTYHYASRAILQTIALRRTQLDFGAH